MNTVNQRRALWAEIALDAFRAEVGLDAVEDTLSDLLSDLGHLCDAKGLDYLALVAKAIGDWTLEQVDPESIDCRPKVTITVGARRD